MDWIRPSRSELLKAVDAYLSAAYAPAPVPKSVQARVEAIASAPEETLYEQAVFEADRSKPDQTHYALRLGNRVYPHMKLIIERSPVGEGHLYRADTHDQHVRRPPPGTRDAELFAQLLSQNLSIAQQIDIAWERAGMPTFKAYLRRDLARRAAARAGSQGNAAPPC